MNYELAKKLKDAGFSQEVPDWRSDPCYSFIDDNEGEVYYDPTLSELIEACGDNFWQLTRDDGVYKWVTYTHSPLPLSRENGFYSGGNTPEEAVANFWLELNKKKLAKKI